MREFKIIHVYGKLAPLPWETSDGSIEYASKYLTNYFADYSKNLKIIYDERRNQTDEIVDIISSANKILFFGFGYAEENLASIGLDKPILKKHQRLFGTAYKLTEMEIDKNKALLMSNNVHMSEGKFHFVNCDSKMLLRNHLL